MILWHPSCRGGRSAPRSYQSPDVASAALCQKQTLITLRYVNLWGAGQSKPAPLIMHTKCERCR
ncbi:hypothetical protein DVQ19_11220 [Yersinia enterocolitica]|nr:hypothetical protein [Yersinia enterocolitica]EKN5127239.1 hypothetical protein [Yersinia enterocolitica]EKN5928754.1 hypothetical protein [Yersinia enterocolitica]EKN5951962.1 hypothetical protein [Yersinia enterocolitica]EKN5979946.1 hypothetical protein [Yersinia enterocolitica]